MQEILEHITMEKWRNRASDWEFKNQVQVIVNTAAQ